MGPVSEVGPEPSACRIRWSPHVDSLSMELNRRMDDLRVSGVRTHPCTPPTYVLDLGAEPLGIKNVSHVQTLIGMILTKSL